MGEWGVDRMGTDLDEIHQMDGVSRPCILLYAYANSVATPTEIVSAKQSRSKMQMFVGAPIYHHEGVKLFLGWIRTQCGQFCNLRWQ
jgi:hypothetical protein